MGGEEIERGSETSEHIRIVSTSFPKDHINYYPDGGMYFRRHIWGYSPRAPDRSSPAQVQHLDKQQQQQVVSEVHLFDDLGNLTGRLLFAFLVVRISGQRQVLRSFLVPALLVFPFVFLFAAKYDLKWLEYSVAVAVALMVAQFSFWGNSLPRVFPTHLRGTGESFAANIGGRMIGSSAALLATELATIAPGTASATRLAHAAAGVALLVYSVSLIASFWLPEPRQELPV